jgi:hypothetical protein
VQSLSDTELRATLALVRHHGGITAAAAAAGVVRTTMWRRYVAARAAFPDFLDGPTGKADVVARRAAAEGLVGGPPIPEAAVPPEGFIVTRNSGAYDAEGNLLRQWVGTQVDAGEVYVPPLGHIIKGESALLTPDGRVMQRWVKTKEGSGEGLIQALQEAFANYEGMAPPIPAPARSDDDLLTIYPLPDLHFGMLAWGKETGTAYDIKIATEMALNSIETLVSQSRPSTHAVLLGLGDYFHADNQKNVTPGSGHQLDVDSRWAKTFADGAILATKMIEILARKHQFVESRWLAGNHDVDSAMCLTVALDMFYRSNPRITVNTDPGIAYYRRFGKCLIGATHGHSAKMDKLPMMMASDRAEDWGLTVHRSFFSAHIHTETVREVGGVRVESLQSPAARDAWNAASGYRSGRSLSAITFHSQEGEIGRHRVNLFGSSFKPTP